MFRANLADFDRKGFTNIPPPLLEDYTKIQKKILSFDLKDLNLSLPNIPLQMQHSYNARHKLPIFL